MTKIAIFIIMAMLILSCGAEDITPEEIEKIELRNLGGYELFCIDGVEYILAKALRGITGGNDKNGI